MPFRKYFWESLEAVPAELEEDILRRGGTVKNVLMQRGRLSERNQVDLAETVDQDGLWLLSQNPYLKPAAQEIVLDRIEQVDESMGTMALEPRLQWRLVEKARHVWETIACREDLVPEIRDHFLQEAWDDENVMAALASNPSTPGDVLERLLDHPAEYVGYYLARNEKLSIDHVRRLYQQGGSVAEVIALHTKHADLLTEILAIEIARGDDFSDVAANPNLPPDQQVQLATMEPLDNVTIVRLVGTGSTCLAAQEVLMGREDVPKKALLALLCFESEVHPGLRAVVENTDRFDSVLAESPHATPQDVERIAMAGLYDKELASRRNLPLDVSMLIARRATPEVMYLLAASSRYPEVLQYIVANGSHRDRFRASVNENYPWTDENLVADALIGNEELLEEVRYRSGVDREAWDAFVDKWHGTIAELVEACKLVNA